MVQITPVRRCFTYKPPVRLHIYKDELDCCRSLRSSSVRPKPQARPSGKPIKKWAHAISLGAQKGVDPRWNRSRSTNNAIRVLVSKRRKLRMNKNLAGHLRFSCSSFDPTKNQPYT